MQTRKNDPYASKSTFFDAQVQEDWAAKAYGPDERRKLERMFAMTGPLAGMKLLEPGCGTGRLTELLVREVGPLGHVVAVDISPSMIALARLKLSGCDHVEFHLGPVEEKIGVENFFDMVICHQVFPHFANQPGALVRISRMLKPGGHLMISHFISFAEINDVHRKAVTAVESDVMPPVQTMQRMLGQCSFVIENWLDDSEGYLLKARLIRK